jgi:hypothetical protein
MKKRTRTQPPLLKKGDLVKVRTSVAGYSDLLGTIQELESESPYDATLDRYQVRLNMTRAHVVFWATQLIKQARLSDLDMK